MSVAVYPGSFDPITYGHLDIIERASAIFDRVIVAVCLNTGKKPLFTIEERVEMIIQESSGLPNVEADSFEGLLTEFMRQKKAHVIIRGMRAVSDLENEFQMAWMNRKLNPEVETLFLMAQPRYSYLSSSIVKEVASFRGDVSGLVSEQIARRLEERLAMHWMKQEASRSGGESVDLFKLLEETEEYIQGCRHLPMTDKVLVSEDTLLDFIDRLRSLLPEELHQARLMVKDREQMMEDARAEAERVVAKAKQRIEDMVKESEVVKQAQAAAEEIMGQTRRVAHEIKNNATLYADDIMSNLQESLEKNLAVIREGREELVQLKKNRQTAING